jgi:cyanophycin synthetase
VLTQIDVNRILKIYLKLNYTLETIPEMGDVVYLKSTANLSTGSTSVDNRYAASQIFYERFRRVIGLIFVV